jgi:hypothetical protein
MTRPVMGLSARLGNRGRKEGRYILCSGEWKWSQALQHYIDGRSAGLYFDVRLRAEMVIQVGHFDVKHPRSALG